jgi:malate dehydrogenase (oxaloacetate-decarboxylating)(NADP+)
MEQYIYSTALLNALELAGKKIQDVQIVISGAGSRFLVHPFVKLAQEYIMMFDIDGLITKSRTDLGEMQMQFATDKNSNLQMLKGAMYFGLSAGISFRAHGTQHEQSYRFYAMAQPDARD